MGSKQRFLTLMLGALVAMSGLCVAWCQEDDAAQEKDMAEMTIGSTAPNLDIEHWVQDGEGKFPKVTQFETGKVYVVEFWATWCGPCRDSMPHLAETQAKYADKGVQIISVSDEDLDTVSEFLESDAEEEKTFDQLTSSYCLTTDPDESTHNDYLRAAQQNGIPCAFLVGKDGKIEWIGHPMEMDEPLAQVVDGKWDREAFKVAFVERQQFEVKMNKIFGLMRSGKSEEAMELMDEVIASTTDEATKTQLQYFRVQMLVAEGSDDAPKAVAELTESSDDAMMLNQIAWTIFQRAEMQGEPMSKELLQSVTDAAEKAVKISPDEGAILDTLAHLVHLQGDLDRAIELQTKAVEQGSEGSDAELKAFLEQLKQEKAEKNDK